jgi:signal transduction histidine kinase
VRIAQQRLELRISDNGIGFPPDAAAEGNGVASIRQRAIRIGGVLTIDSQPGQGTTVSVSVPIGHRHRRFL